jgi:uncharacterized membrane protein (UPF0127 family)
MFSSKEKYTEVRLWHVGFFGIIAVVAGVLFLWSKKIPTVDLVLRNEKFTMLLANTPDRWFKGLSGRASLENYDGMLFVFPDYEPRALVMRDMKFPLDIIWLNGDKVVDMRSNVMPENKKEPELTQYLPVYPANGVLEVTAGFIEKYSIQVGDTVVVDK